jgi:8-oxo-dGTP pyrophosphatase MutT (NUDIX family)
VEAAVSGRGERLGLSDELIRAGGAVVARRRDGSLEVLLVHRAKYDDWSFPKGKCADGESDEECALREVQEETNLSVKLGGELVATEYVSKGRPKRVRYWLGEAQHPEAARAQNEVDEIAWVTPAEAEARLSYDRDVDVLRAALDRLGG